MANLSRREYLKQTAIIGAGSAVYGCASDTGTAQAKAPVQSDIERGAVPIANSGWTKPKGEAAAYPALQSDLRADVVVVGAGLAGSSLTLHLAQAGIDVVLLEARQPGWGASGRNAGHVLPTLRDLDALKRFPDQGKAFLQRFNEHHRIAFDLAAQYSIDCDAAQNGYLDACLSERAFAKFSQMSTFWQQQGQQVSYFDKGQMQTLVGSDYYPYGVFYHSGGRINPYRFTHGMVAAAIDHKARVFGDSEALTLSKNAQGWRVATAAGSVLADRVVFCTNAYPNGVVPAVCDNFYPLTAYAMSFEPLPEVLHKQILPSRCAFAQMPIDLNPMVIDEHHRIIVSSIPASNAAYDQSRYANFHRRWLQRTWPVLKDYPLTVESYWTGRVALRDENFPGAFALGDGVFGLMHFNAWGNTMAPLMAKLMAEALQADDMSQLPYPLQQPVPVANPNKQDWLIRKLMIPAARVGQWMNII
jgi:glycine/D-amino acid oxidase-like deaminating enzyme